MIEFTCPTTGATLTRHTDALLSVHRTAAGRVAYLRCDCEGLAVLTAHGREGWRPVGHAAGPEMASTRPVVPATRCA